MFDLIDRKEEIKNLQYLFCVNSGKAFFRDIFSYYLEEIYQRGVLYGRN